ncbi:MAG: transglycosylase domain-containing protein [Fimbriimonadaceae bacterium]|nr:transglycosylase domain-containing protein [Fimbriimonadaceae bacterium]
MERLSAFKIGFLAAGLVAILTLSAISAAAVVSYWEATDLIDAGGEAQLVTDPAVTVFARPHRVTAGRPASIKELRDKLLANGYRETDQGGRGTFSLSRTRLTLYPSWPEFPNVVIDFDGNVPVHIQGTDGRTYAYAEFESELIESVEYRGNQPVSVLYLPRTWEAFRGTALADAVVIREDDDFWTQPDLPSQAMLRAAYHLGGAGGASGFYSQMARNSVMRDRSRSWLRKWREIGVASALAARVPRERMAELYFNKVRLGAVRGREIIGYPALGRALFGVREAADLSWAQSATLAVITSSPSGYIGALLRMPEESVPEPPPAVWWRRWVPAGLFKKQGHLSVEQRLGRLLRARNAILDEMGRRYPHRYPVERLRSAKDEPLQVRTAPPFDQGRELAGHFLDMLLSGKVPLHEGRIHASLDLEIQQVATNALQDHLARLASKLHVANPDNLQGTMIVLHPQTGEILALLGGRNTSRGTLNRALTPRSAGSAMKVLVFAWAVDHARRREVDTYTVVDGARDAVEGKWRPKRHCGGSATLYRHMGSSTNCPPIVLASWIGLRNLQQLYRNFLHVTPDLHAGMAIGGSKGSEVRMLDLALVYSALANEGTLPDRVLVSRLGNADRVIAPDLTPAGRAFSKHAAEQALQIMTAPVQPYGTAAQAVAQTGLAAGELLAKTGTGAVSDAVFVSILGNKDLLFLAWVGMDDYTPLEMNRGFQGATAAMPIVTRVIRELTVKRPEYFHFSLTPTLGGAVKASYSRNLSVPKRQRHREGYPQPHTRTRARRVNR